MCPSPIWTDYEYTVMSILFPVCSFVGIALSIPMFIFYACSKSRRTFPRYLPVMVVLTTFLIALSMHWVIYVGYKDYLCVDSTTPITQGNSATCAVQGFLGTIFPVSLSTWVFVLSINMCLIAFQRFPEEPRKRRILEILYHVFAWGLPLILAIVALAVDAIKPQTVFCFVAADYDEESNSWSNDKPNFIVLMWVCIFASSSVIICLIVSIQIYRSLGLPGLLANFRLFLLILVAVVVTVVWMAWSWGQKPDDQVNGVDELTAWALCVATQPITGLPCPTEIDPTNWAFLMFAFTFNMATCILFALIMGWSDPDMYRWYWAVLRCRKPKSSQSSLRSSIGGTGMRSNTSPRSSTTSPRSTGSINSSTTGNSEPLIHL